MGQWSQASVAGKTTDVFHPTTRPRFGVLFLHPHGDETLAHPVANPTWTDALERVGLACCCPHASRTWWSDKLYPPFDPTITAEKCLLTQVLPWMRDHWNLPERAVAVAGISMGGQGALRLAFKHSDLLPVAAGIASAVDYHLLFNEPAFTELPQLYRSQEQCRQDTATLQIVPHAAPRHLWFACDPKDDVWHRGNERLHEKLNAVGVPHTADLMTSHGGHTWDYFNAMATPMLDFLLRSLDQENRRLIIL